MITHAPSHKAMLLCRLVLSMGLVLLLAAPVCAQRRQGPGQRLEQRMDVRREAAGANKEQRDELIQFIHETFPEKARQLDELRKRNPTEFQRRRNLLVDEVRRLMELKDRDPGLFRVQVDEMRLRDEINRLARESRGKAEGGRERQEAEKQLWEAVQRSFDLRQQIKQAELAELRGRLKELESSLERRSARRAQMIDDRLRELLKSGEEEW